MGTVKFVELGFRIVEHMAAGGEGLQAANKQGSKVSAIEPLPVVGTIVFQLRMHICRNISF
jgi:hypothetical protein